MISSDQARFLFDYDRWANERVFEATAKLGGEEFLRDLGSSFRSVRDTLVHVVSAAWIWLARWNGENPRALHDPQEFPTPEAVRRLWSRVEEDRGRWLDGVDDARIAADLVYRDTRGSTFRLPLSASILHVVNHSTYHRGQVATLIRQLGGEPIATDLAFLVRKSSG